MKSYNVNFKEFFNERLFAFTFMESKKNGYEVQFLNVNDEILNDPISGAAVFYYLEAGFDEDKVFFKRIFRRDY